MELIPRAFSFLQGSAAISQNLASLNQWKLHFSVTKQFRWGGGIPAEGIDRSRPKPRHVVGTVERLGQDPDAFGRGIGGGIRLRSTGAAS